MRRCRDPRRGQRAGNATINRKARSTSDTNESWTVVLRSPYHRAAATYSSAASGWRTSLGAPTGLPDDPPPNRDQGNRLDLAFVYLLGAAINFRSPRHIDAFIGSIEVCEQLFDQLDPVRNGKFERGVQHLLRGCFHRVSRSLVAYHIDSL